MRERQDTLSSRFLVGTAGQISRAFCSEHWLNCPWAIYTKWWNSPTSFKYNRFYLLSGLHRVHFYSCKWCIKQKIRERFNAFSSAVAAILYDTVFCASSFANNINETLITLWAYLTNLAPQVDSSFNYEIVWERTVENENGKTHIHVRAHVQYQ